METEQPVATCMRHARKSDKPAACSGLNTVKFMAFDAKAGGRRFEGMWN